MELTDEQARQFIENSRNKPRARIIAIQVIPQIVIDDGNDLLPQQVQPMTVLWRDWPQFAAHGLQDALEKLQEQIDAQSADSNRAG